LFNGKTDNHALDPVRIPSLRGARYLAPYGHDGRMASLRDFVRPPLSIIGSMTSASAGCI
jgi:cytochrome c peroxidase